MNDEILKPTPGEPTPVEIPETTFIAGFFIRNRASSLGDHTNPNLLEQAENELLEEGVLYINKRGKTDHKSKPSLYPLP